VVSHVALSFLARALSRSLSLPPSLSALEHKHRYQTLFVSQHLSLHTLK
jgi:hypothetical protein